MFSHVIFLFCLRNVRHLRHIKLLFPSVWGWSSWNMISLAVSDRLPPSLGTARFPLSLLLVKPLTGGAGTDAGPFPCVETTEAPFAWIYPKIISCQKCLKGVQLLNRISSSIGEQIFEACMRHLSSINLNHQNISKSSKIL